MKTLIVELIIALILEVLRNTVISLNPPSVETWLGFVGVRIDQMGLHFLYKDLNSASP